MDLPYVTARQPDDIHDILFFALFTAGSVGGDDPGLRASLRCFLRTLQVKCGISAPQGGLVTLTQDI